MTFEASKRKNTLRTLSAVAFAFKRSRPVVDSKCASGGYPQITFCRLCPWMELRRLTNSAHRLDAVVTQGLDLNGTLLVLGEWISDAARPSPRHSATAFSDLSALLPRAA